MTKKNYLASEESGQNEKKHKDSSHSGKPKTNNPETATTKTTEQIIQETSIKRQKAIKELANR